MQRVACSSLSHLIWKITRERIPVKSRKFFNRFSCENRLLIRIFCRYVCEVCDKGFARHATLWNHRRWDWFWNIFCTLRPMGLIGFELLNFFVFVSVQFYSFRAVHKRRLKWKTAHKGSLKTPEKSRRHLWTALCLGDWAMNFESIVMLHWLGNCR